MRITQGKVIHSLLYDLQQAGQRLQISESQLASLKKINKISDNPVDSVTALRLRASMDSLEQHKANTQDATSRLEMVESSLDVLSEILFSAKSLTVQANTGTLSAQSRLALAQEVDALIRHAADIANESFQGKLLFGGHNSGQRPASLVESDGRVTGVSLQNDPGDIFRQIGKGISLKINYSADQVFGAQGANVFDDLLLLRRAVEDGDSNALEALGTSLEAHSDRTIGLRTETGAKLNRLALDLKKQIAETITLRESLSDIVDTDVAETMLEAKVAEYAYEAALAVGARIMMPSLLDFLK